MNEIEFRAWHEKYGYSEPFTILQATSHGFTPIFPKCGTIPGWWEDCIIDQFINLKDKNGQKVFQGDIVNCSSGCPHVIEWKQELGGKYFGGMPGWYLSDLLSGGGEGYAWTGNEEVIGNVRENPELLKKNE